MDIRKLQHIVTVADTGNISVAAQQLHISQPALSRSIANFEKESGIQIFDRSRSGAALTPQGRKVIAETRSLLQQAKALKHNMQLYGKGEAGEIDIGIGPLIASILLPELGQHLLKQRPGLKLNTSIKSADKLLVELKTDAIEVLYVPRVYVGDENDLIVDPVGGMRISRLARANHPLTKKRKVHIADLQNYPTLSGAEISSQLDKSGGFVCDNYHILKDILPFSDGILVGSKRLLEKEITRGEVVEIKLTDEKLPQEIEICAVRRRAITPSPAATFISDFLQSFFD